MRPRTKNSATRIATKTTAATAIPAIAPLLSELPPEDPWLLPALPAAVVDVLLGSESESELVDDPPSAGGACPGTNI